MLYVYDELDKCPTCGETIDDYVSDGEEWENSTRLVTYCTCRKCGTGIATTFGFIQHEVYTKEEWKL